VSKIDGQTQRDRDKDRETERERDEGWRRVEHVQKRNGLNRETKRQRERERVRHRDTTEIEREGVNKKE
jgi:hypothetical protein